MASDFDFWNQSQLNYVTNPYKYNLHNFAITCIRNSNHKKKKDDEVEEDEEKADEDNKRRQRRQRERRKNQNKRKTKKHKQSIVLLLINHFCYLFCKTAGVSPICNLISTVVIIYLSNSWR